MLTCVLLLGVWDKAMTQDVGVIHIDVENCDPAYRLITIGDLHTAHLIDTSGRHLYTWSKPGRYKWVGSRLDSKGNLMVELENGRIRTLSIDGEWLDAEIPVDSKGLGNTDSLSLNNQNHLALADPVNVLRETDRKGNIVWEYVNQDADLDENPYSVSSFQSYYASDLELLFSTHPFPVPFTDTELRQQRRNPQTDIQYKRLNRETVAEIEAGYLDDAHNFLMEYFELYPDDEEGFWAMSVLQTRRGNISKAWKYAQMALKAGLPISRYTAGLDFLLEPLLESPAFLEAYEQYTHEEQMLVHGPVLGQLTDSSVAVWVRTTVPSYIQLDIYDSEQAVGPVSTFAGKSYLEDENTAVIQVDGLESQHNYLYQLRIAGDEVGSRHSFTTMSKIGEPTTFKVGFSGGAGYTPWFERMWDTLATHDLDMFFLMGDNVYIDHPERPLTQRYCYYRRQSRPEFQRFTANTAVYAIWDDHDFTYNDERGGPEVDEPYWKRDVWNVFKNQWINPYYGGGEEHPGCYHDFSVGDVDFFMLDCRYYREDPENEGASMLGTTQKEWLKEKLKASTGTFKVIASSVPWAMNTKPGSLDTWDGHPEEREEIFSFIEAHQIEGVLLISADRHRSDAWRIERPDGYDFYDLMSSKLTNVHTHRVMPGSLFGYNQTCSFGLLEFDTTRDNPQVRYRIINIENEEIHRMTIYQDQLTYKNK